MKTLEVYRKNGELRALIHMDDKDYERVKDLNVQVIKNYPCVRIGKNLRPLARFILDLNDKSVEIGYRDRNQFNIKRENLRIRTRNQGFASRRDDIY